MGTGGTPRVRIDPDEDFTVAFDYDANEDLPAGAIISSGVVSSSRVSDGLDSSSAMLTTTTAIISNGGLRTAADVLGGGAAEAGEEHLVKIVNTLSNGDVLVDKFLLLVADDSGG